MIVNATNQHTRAWAPRLKRKDWPTDFGNFLRYLRIRRGYTLQQLSDAIGENRPNLSNVENGNRAPWRSFRRYEMLAKSLGIRQDSPEFYHLYMASRLGEDTPKHIRERALIPR